MRAARSSVAGWEEKNYSDPAERARNLIKFDPKGCWERAFREEYKPVFSKTVKGYTFVGAHWPGIGGLGDWLAVLGINFRVLHLAWYTMAAEAKRDYPASISFQSSRGMSTAYSTVASFRIQAASSIKTALMEDVPISMPILY